MDGTIEIPPDEITNAKPFFKFVVFANKMAVSIQLEKFNNVFKECKTGPRATMGVTPVTKVFGGVALVPVLDRICNIFGEFHNLR